jgi:transcriptional regulator with XRE-family HTH domain
MTRMHPEQRLGTTADSSFRPEAPGWVGPRVREARHRRGLSQADVAAATGISESFIRLLERGRTDISLSRLLAVCSAVGVAPSELIRDAYSSVIQVARREDRIDAPGRESGVQLKLLFPAGESALEPALFELEPGVAMQKALLHRGREFVFVLEGQVRLEVGAATVDLAPGDASDYQSSIPHRFSNLSSRIQAVFLIVDAG